LIETAFTDQGHQAAGATTCGHSSGFHGAAGREAAMACMTSPLTSGLWP
jgi:hypothetical protein